MTSAPFFQELLTSFFKMNLSRDIQMPPASSAIEQRFPRTTALTDQDIIPPHLPGDEMGPPTWYETPSYLRTNFPGIVVISVLLSMFYLENSFPAMSFPLLENSYFLSS